MADDFFAELPFVDTEPGVIPEVERATRRDDLAAGSFWTLHHRAEGYVVDYVSGEVEGRAKSVVITEAEAHRLLIGDDSAAIDVIRDHDGS